MYENDARYDDHLTSLVQPEELEPRIEMDDVVIIDLKLICACGCYACNSGH